MNIHQYREHLNSLTEDELRAEAEQLFQERNQAVSQQENTQYSLETACQSNRSLREQLATSQAIVTRRG